MKIRFFRYLYAINSYQVITKQENKKKVLKSREVVQKKIRLTQSLEKSQYC